MSQEPHFAQQVPLEVGQNIQNSTQQFSIYQDLIKSLTEVKSLDPKTETLLSMLKNVTNTGTDKKEHLEFNSSGHKEDINGEFDGLEDPSRTPCDSSFGSGKEHATSKNRIFASSKVNFTKLSNEEKLKRCYNLANQVKHFRRRVRNLEERLIRVKTAKLKEENSEEAERILKYSRACIKLRDYQNFEIVDQHFVLENLAELILENNLPLNSVAFDLICTIIRSFTPENKKNYYSSLEKTMARGAPRKKLFITFPEKEIEITSRERYYYGDFKYNEHILRIITGLIDQFTSATEMLGSSLDQNTNDVRSRQAYPFIKNQNPKIEMNSQVNIGNNHAGLLSNKTMQGSHQLNQVTQQVFQKTQQINQKSVQPGGQLLSQASQMCQQLNQQYPGFIPFQQFNSRPAGVPNLGISLPKPTGSFDQAPNKNGDENKLARMFFPELSQLQFQQFGQASMFGNPELFSQMSTNSTQTTPSSTAPYLQQKNSSSAPWQSQSLQK